MMKKRIGIIATLLVTLAIVSFGQKGGSTEKSDPAATKILNALKKDYDSYKAVEIKFDLELELPNQKKEIQKGTMIQEGDKYMVSLNDQEIYNDGKAMWIFLKSENEVQINNADDGSDKGMLSPKDILRLYESGEYFYAITGERVEGKNTLTEIEFKPLNKNSEYSKMRLSVNKKTNKASSLIVFSKDGSKFTLKIKDMLTNKAYNKDTFVFNKTTHPGVRIEDLRID